MKENCSIIFFKLSASQGMCSAKVIPAISVTRETSWMILLNWGMVISPFTLLKACGEIGLFENCE